MLKHKLYLTYAYTIGVLGLRPSDVMLTSYPRTGNTWIRFILCNYLSLQELQSKDMTFQMMDDIMPALGKSNLIKSWPYQSIPRLVKTHRPYNALFFSRPSQTIYILRDPRDIMVSYFHFLQGNLWYPYKGTFSEFIRQPKYGLEACIRHYFSWQEQIDYMVRYPDLKKDTHGEITRMLESVGVTMDSQLLHEAIERSSLQRMRDVQKTTGIAGPKRHSKDFQFARRGKSGQWPQYFEEDDLTYYNNLLEKYNFDVEALLS